MIDISNLNFYYGSSQILFDVSLKAKNREITCLMGSNGVGKTSLLKFLSGIYPSKSGNYYFDGDNVTNLSSHQLAKRGVGYVPQGRFIFPLLSVRENLETGFACLKSDEHFIPDEIFDLFPVLKQMINRRGGDLSGGQQQQLAIARALLMRPKVLILDEPTEGIQPSIIKIIRDVILHVKEVKKTTIVLVEQYFDFVQDIADEVVIMDRGKVFKSGKVRILKDKNIKNILAV